MLKENVSKRQQDNSTNDQKTAQGHQWVLYTFTMHLSKIQLCI